MEVQLGGMIITEPVPQVAAACYQHSRAGTNPAEYPDGFFFLYRGSMRGRVKELTFRAYGEL